MTAIPRDIAFLQWLIDQGYKHPRPLSGGRYAAIWPLMYTHAIIVGQIGDAISYDDRWCYAGYDAARTALDAWNGEGEPAGWTRHPRTGRRVSQSPDERDGDGRPVGAIGVVYVHA